MKALDTITATVIKEDPRRTFRIESAREEIGIDTITTIEAVNKIALLIEGELEESTTSLKPTVPEVKSTKGKGKDGKGKEGKGKESWKEPCYFFNEAEDGCNKGQQCTRYHRKLNPDEKKCQACGSTKHPTEKCDRPKKSDPSSPKGSSKGEKGKSGKGKSKGKGLETTTVPKEDPEKKPIKQPEKQSTIMKVQEKSSLKR